MKSLVVGFWVFELCVAMAESAAGEMATEEAGRRAGAGVEDVEHAASAYQLLLACPAGVPGSLVSFSWFPSLCLLLQECLC